MKACVLGLGYIGLPTAATMATHGFEVVGVDVQQRVVDAVNEGRAHISEPDLDMLVRGAVAEGRFRATTECEAADIYVVAVPTPLREGTRPDISYVEQATRAIAPHLQSGNLVILESTSPPGTTRRMAALLAEERPDLTFPQDAPEQADVMVAHCPERVLPGRTLIELISNDRIIGGMDVRSAEQARNVYRVFVKGQCLLTEATTAELVKLSENAFRDVNIAFANELSLISAELGVDVWDVIALANRHPRVSILNPGPGVGGHCISVDPWFIVDADPERSRLIRTARQVNDAKPHAVIAEIRRAIEGLTDGVVAVLGLAFKANIDDLRESPALEIAEALAEIEASVLVVEPYIDTLPDVLSGRDNVDLVDAATAIGKADVVALLVDHDEFSRLDRNLLVGKRVVDTCGLWR